MGTVKNKLRMNTYHIVCSLHLDTKCLHPLSLKIKIRLIVYYKLFRKSLGQWVQGRNYIRQQVWKILLNCKNNQDYSPLTVAVLLIVPVSHCSSVLKSGGGGRVGVGWQHCMLAWLPATVWENGLKRAVKIILPTLHDETNDDCKEDLLMPSPCENQQYQDKKLSSKYY